MVSVCLFSYELLRQRWGRGAFSRQGGSGSSFKVFEIQLFSVIPSGRVSGLPTLWAFCFSPFLSPVAWVGPRHCAADSHKTDCKRRKETSDQFCLLIALVQFAQKD